MKFRDDIDPASTWVVSDTHFGHQNIVGFCHRPEDHGHVMMEEWARAVPEDATLLHLGDLCYKGNSQFKHMIAPHLTGGRKLLIQGNHDRQRAIFYRESGFRLVRPFAILVVEGEDGMELFAEANDFKDPTRDYVNCWRVSFSHYPWNVEEDGHPIPHDIRIHGHIHNNGYSRDAFVPFLKNHINLSVEQTKYRPVNLKLLLDAYLLGSYPETTPEQLAEARARKEANRASSSSS